MKKTFCDKCENEIKDYSHHTNFKVLKHITANNTFNCHVTTINGKLEPTSKVEVSFDLCISCYNRVMKKAFKEFLNTTKEE